MTDSLERYLQDLDFDLPTGLVERAVASAAADRKPDSATPAQLAREPFGAELTNDKVARVRTEFNMNRAARPHRALVFVAALLVIAVVVTLVFTARLMRTSHEVPANKAPQAEAGGFVVSQSFFSSSDAAVLVDESTPRHPAPAQLEITHDGGQTWLRSGITGPVVDVTWLDSHHLVVVSADMKRPPVWEITADGGHHWRIINPPVPASSFENVYFLDSFEGWGWSCSGCGLPSAPVQQWTVWHTVDSGAHWEQLGDPFSLPGAMPLGLRFVDSQRGFTGASTTDGAGRLIVTQDGGVTWRVVDLPEPAGGWSQPGLANFGCSCTLAPVMFGQEGVLLVEGATAQKWFTYTTADGGLTWGNPQVLPLLVTQPPGDPWQAPLDAENWWISDAHGLLYRTDDGGKTWRSSRPSLPAGYSLTYAKPVSAKVLWGVAVASGDHFLVRSSDGGATWSAVKTPRAQS